MSSSVLKLVSVNTAPERAKVVIGKVIEGVKDRYKIEDVANCERIEDVRPTVERFRPDILFCASMWTPEQQEEIQKIAREVVPGIKTHAIPTGLQVKVGPDGIVSYLMERIDEVMAQ
ncbi:hypothetical protein JCM10213_004266 [Rhodosporidiobolus nylandii]